MNHRRLWNGSLHVFSATRDFSILMKSGMQLWMILGCGVLMSPYSMASLLRRWMILKM
jgi:hypothetical protein